MVDSSVAGIIGAINEILRNMVDSGVAGNAMGAIMNNTVDSIVVTQIMYVLGYSCMYYDPACIYNR